LIEENFKLFENIFKGFLNGLDDVVKKIDFKGTTFENS
jgi:hypothetical protein